VVELAERSAERSAEVYAVNGWQIEPYHASRSGSRQRSWLSRARLVYE